MHRVLPSDYRKYIQHKVVLLIEKKLKRKEITADTAKKISLFVLDAINESMSVDEMYQKVKHFSHYFPELQEVVTSAVKEQAERKRYILAHEVGKLLKAKEYTKANYILSTI